MVRNYSATFSLSTFLVLMLAVASTLYATTKIMAQETTEVSRWESRIKAFEELDREQMPPKQAILFVGSSSIVFWRTLHEDMAPLKVINRGFGGSQMFELNMFRDRIVTPYEPRAIVVYEGDNDVAAGKSHDEILAAYADFISHIEEKLPATDICIIAVKPSILREQLWPQMEAVNESLQALAESKENMCFLDIAEPMQEGDEFVRADLFVGDGLHLNAKGYELWTSVVKPVLMAKFGSDPTNQTTE